MERKVFTVSQVNQYIKSLFDQDFILNQLWIQGEISNFKQHRSGHLYFTLKDKNGAISCVMFRSYANELLFGPEDGMAVMIRGYISVYEKTGQYQIYVHQIEPEGKGALHKAFEQLKQKLETAGYFDAAHKKMIPVFPKAVGIITSDTGAAVRDIIQIARRRNPGIPLILYPVLVQGKDAAASIASAIEDFNQWNEVDTLIIGRGGGSIEDLWAFNEEIVAKAIWDSSIPIISAVGHETDFTISDFVADLRAPTPSAAAELTIPSRAELQETIAYYRRSLNRAINGKISSCNQRLEMLERHPVLQKPLEKVYQKQQYIDQLEKNLQKEVLYKIKDYRTKLSGYMEKLEILSPLSNIRRGYSITKKENGDIVRSVYEVQEGQALQIRLQDGDVIAEIQKIIIKENENGEKETADF